MEPRKGIKRRNPAHRKKFAQEYLINNDANTAIAKLDPHLDNKAVAVKASRWIHDPKVINTIIEEVKSLDLQRSDVKNLIQARLIKIIVGNSKDSDSINASSVLARVEGLLSENTQNNLNIIGSDALEEIVRKSGILGDKKVINHESKGCN